MVDLVYRRELILTPCCFFQACVYQETIHFLSKWIKSEVWSMDKWRGRVDGIVRKDSPFSILSEAVPTLLVHQELLHSHLAERLMFCNPFFSIHVLEKSQFTVTDVFFWMCKLSCIYFVIVFFFSIFWRGIWGGCGGGKNTKNWSAGQNFEKKSLNGWNVQLLNDPTKFLLEFWNLSKFRLESSPKKLHPCCKTHLRIFFFRKEAPCGWSHLEAGLSMNCMNHLGVFLSWMDSRS